MRALYWAAVSPRRGRSSACCACTLMTDSASGIATAATAIQIKSPFQVFHQCPHVLGVQDPLLLSRFLVALPRSRDLLLSAKHLFVAAMVAICLPRPHRNAEPHRQHAVASPKKRPGARPDPSWLAQRDKQEERNQQTLPSPPWREANVTPFSSCNACAGLAIPRQRFAQGRQINARSPARRSAAAAPCESIRSGFRCRNRALSSQCATVWCPKGKAARRGPPS
jgi:hypothetical protein